MVTLAVATGAVHTVPLQKLKHHDADSETAFEATWLPAMRQLLVFYTGWWSVCVVCLFVVGVVFCVFLFSPRFFSLWKSRGTFHSQRGN